MTTLFFLLVFALTAPFLVVGATTDWQLLPGLPFAGLAAFMPAIAALILAMRERGTAGVTALLSRAFDVRRVPSPTWIIAAITIMPAAAALGWLILAATGRPIPFTDRPATLALLFPLFFIAGVGEELGWSGYALGPLQNRFGELRAGLMLGLVWAAWHIPALLEAHRAADWIAWWCVATIAMRVVMVSLYYRGGQSVFVVIVFHAMSNVAWQVAPGAYDPRIEAAILAVLAGIVSVSRRPAQTRPSL